MILKLRTTIYTLLTRRFNTSSALFSEKTSKINIKTLLASSASFSEKNPESDRWISPVYPAKKRLQSEKAIRPKVDPSETTIILFPGQGSQYVGMVKSLLSYPNVEEMFKSASEILRYDLLGLCINGPEDMLNMTAYSQVAVFIASLAAIEKLKTINETAIQTCAGVAGFSVGEYAALVFSGALEFENAVKLLKVRGEAMQSASDMEPGGMMTVFLKPEAKIRSVCATAREWCEEQTISNGECRVGIYLYPDCRVISGHLEALKFIESNAARFGIKKMKYLPVSGAFHSKLMKPARKVLEKALKATPFEKPMIPVYSNIGGHPYATVEQIRKNLTEQLTSPVEWEQLMHTVFERSKGDKFPDVYECGPGTTLKSILRMNNNVAYRKCESILA